MKNKYIYIVLVRALTGLGSFARTFSKYEYTHIAFCYEENKNDFITFSRRKHYSPFDSGFMHETLDCYAFGKNNEVKLKIYKVNTTTQNLKKIKEYVNKIENDKEYIFNIYSMATMPFIHGFTIYKAHNCMSFVSKVLELNEIQMDKPYYKYSIKDIDKLLKDYKYEERLFKKEKIENKNYMDKVSTYKNLKQFISLNKELTTRLIKKGNRYDK